jgi:hypothetical protein
MANPKRQVTSERGLYLYGVSRAAGKKAAPARIASPGIDGVSAVKTIACGDFVCWVSEVDHARFAQAVESNKENLEWLALHGVRHQQVVGEVAAKMAIVPARFGTIFSGEAALVKNVLGRSRALGRVFEHVADADEWGVKVFTEKKTAPVAVSAARSGKEYLQQKAAQVKKRPERNGSELQELVAALEGVASGSAPSGKVSGAQPNLLWQGTFLVPRGRRRQWERVLSEFVERWDGLRRIEVNGPWPPYSFASDAD